MRGKKYPMKVSYVPRERIWGGERLEHLFGKKAPFDRLGETWELTVRPDGMSHVENGAFAGLPLDEVIARLGNDAVSPAYQGGTFPLLIKLIDAQDRLSVQVHPDDAYAARVEHDVGKTEMWVVLAAEPGAELVYGLREGVDRAAFAAAVAAGRVEDVLLRHPVRAGDVCFIPSGLVHAIGAGIVVAEIQQNSDLTYRVYDYNRRQGDGTLRTLHVAAALDVVRPFTAEQIDALRFSRKSGKDDENTLADCDYFRVERITVAGEVSLSVTRDSFAALLCIRGSGTVSGGGETVALSAGECCFVPAGCGTCTLGGDMVLLSSTVS